MEDTVLMDCEGLARGGIPPVLTFVEFAKVSGFFLRDSTALLNYILE
jgi:hypothetical protein